jgi:hypothetical protein
MAPSCPARRPRTHAAQSSAGAILSFLVIALAAAVLLGSRIYENSLLHTGGRVKVLEALRD